MKYIKIIVFITLLVILLSIVIYLSIKLGKYLVIKILESY